jgi:hypothetical protein
MTIAVTQRLTDSEVATLGRIVRSDATGLTQVC